MGSLWVAPGVGSLQELGLLQNEDPYAALLVRQKQLVLLPMQQPPVLPHGNTYIIVSRNSIQIYMYHVNSQGLQVQAEEHKDKGKPKETDSNNN